ncbi:hypothetical protein FQA39_LY12790 [Lamprigera yunnana]|nr:hypothetical protein FQA39_LY12790 [Lamprigera yunnana]
MLFTDFMSNYVGNYLAVLTTVMPTLQLLTEGNLLADGITGSISDGLKYVGAGLAGLGTGFVGIGQGIAGQGACLAIGRNPEMASKISSTMIIIAGIAESGAIYSLILRRLINMDIMSFFMAETTPGIPNIVEMLFPNLPNFIAHVLATIVIVLLLSKLVYAPFREAIDKRREKINELLQDAIDKQLVATKGVKEAEAILSEAKTESSLIIKTAKTDAEVQRENILKTAHTDAMTIQEQAKKNVALEHDKAESEIKETIINTSIQIAAKILEKEIKKEDNEKLINDFIDSLD